MDNPTLKATLEAADAQARRGNFPAAILDLQNVLEAVPDHKQALTMMGRVFRADGQFENADPILRKLCAVEDKNPWNWFDLGSNYEALNDFSGAANAYLRSWSLNTENARFALYAGDALWQDNKKEEAMNVWSMGSDIDPLVRTAQFIAEADPTTQQKSKTADTELRRFFTKMFADGLAKHNNPKRLTSALWPQTHKDAFDYKVENQKPYMFYAPDLPAQPVFDATNLAWASTLKNATPDIIHELEDYLQSTNDYGQPYLAHMSDGEESWAHLQGSEDWNALHLFKDAAKQSCAEFFPKTIAALENAPLVEMFGNYMEVFFSVLKPGTHIPPHFGLSNSRLTAHLPLIVPKNCEIRVSDHVHHWTVGELFLFDDSFDHEARNDSDDIRIVLIFETWRPDLSAKEIEALQDSMEIRAAWFRDRKIPEFKESL